MRDGPGLPPAEVAATGPPFSTHGFEIATLASGQAAPGALLLDRHILRIHHVPGAARLKSMRKRCTVRSLRE
jgi:hypothetical protein